MAELLTTQDMVDGRLDVQTLKEAVNEDKIITPRIGQEYASVPMASRLLIENGLLSATPFANKGRMTSSTLANESYAVVTDDFYTKNNGVYRKVDGEWVRQSYNLNNMSHNRVVWNKVYSGASVSYNDTTRTLTVSSVIIANIESYRIAGRSSLILKDFNVTIPNSTYMVVFVDLSAITATGDIVASDVVKVGSYSSSGDSRFTGESHQLPIFTVQAGISRGINGFFENQITGATKPYYIPAMESQINSAASLSTANTTKISALQSQVDNIDTSGNSGASAVYPTFIDAGELKKSTSEGLKTILNPTPDSFIGSSHQNAKNTIATLSRDTIATTTPVAIGGDDGFVGSAMVLPSDPNVMLVIPSFGQSNSVGAVGYDPDVALTENPYAETLLMPAGVGRMDIRMNMPSGSEAAGSEIALNPDDITGFQSLKAMRTESELTLGATPLESMGLVFADAVYKGMGIKPRICMFAGGWGGRFQYQLEKGKIPYQNFMTALTKIKQLAAAEGLTVYVPFVVIVHGESDSARVQYMQGIKDWQTEMNGDIKTITNQQGDVPFLCSQASTFRKQDNYGVLAPYDASKTSNTHYLSAPYYPYELAFDNLHLGKSAAYLGEKLAHTAARIYGLFGSQRYGALQPKSVTYNNDKQIDIDFNVPVFPLTRDTTDPIVNNPAPADWGFVVRDGTGAAVPIASINIIGSSVRIITSSIIPSGSLRAVEYALNGFGDTKVTGQQPRGQLRDAEELESIIDGKLLRNWCLHFRELF